MLNDLLKVKIDQFVHTSKSNLKTKLKGIKEIWKLYFILNYISTKMED